MTTIPRGTAAGAGIAVLVGTLGISAVLYLPGRNSAERSGRARPHATAAGPPGAPVAGSNLSAAGDPTTSLGTPPGRDSQASPAASPHPTPAASPGTPAAAVNDSARATVPAEPGLTATAQPSPSPEPSTGPPATPAPVPTPLSGTVIAVATSADLTAALAQARPGQTIELADGTYTGNFVATNSGTPSALITLYGSSKAVIVGGSLRSGYGFHLSGASYWQLVGFSVTDAGKGIVLDGSSHSVISGVTVSDIGDEGIHLRKGSSDDVVELSHVYNTGLKTAIYGEGIYVGSAIKNWPLYWTVTDPGGNKVDGSDHDEILDNTVSATGSESIDTKEGTLGGIIAGNTLQSPGAGSAAIDVKGNDYTVEDNTINGAPNNDHGAIEVWELVTGYGADNTLIRNRLGATGSAVGIYVSSGATGTLVSCSNTVAGPTAGLSNLACQAT